MADLIDKIKLIKDYISDRRTMLELGNQAKDLIYKRVKAGQGVNSLQGNNISKERLLRLKPGYILFRIKHANELGKFGEPDYSNLTLTGQMLDSMEVDAKDGEFKIFIPNTSRRGIGGKKDKNSNKKIAEYVQKKRPFLALTSAETQILKRTVDRNIRTLVKRLFV